MTLIDSYANPPTRRGPAARFSASARPIPRASRYRRTRDAAFWPICGTTVERSRITATVVSILALVVLVVVAPPAVTMPTLVVLATALIVGGLFRMVAHVTRPIPLAPCTVDSVTRSEA
jgi:hypothetical protein